MNTVQTDDAPRAIGPYSQAVQVDGWLYASGQLRFSLPTYRSRPGRVYHPS